MRIALLITIGIVLLCGCRVNPNAEREIALLRAEILDLEDQYYSLKSQRDNAVTQLRDCQGVSFDESQFANESLGECIDCEDGAVIYDTSPIVYEDTVIGGGIIDGGMQPVELNTIEQNQPLERGRPFLQNESQLEEVPAVETEDGGNSDGSTSILNRPNVTQNAVRAIRINRQLSQGVDLDGVAGHEGLSLLVQPIDGRGEVVESGGQMSIQLLERDRLASSRQIGFWRFTPEEIRTFQVRKGLPLQGILLHLPWSQILPTKNDVNVVVNFVAPGNVRYTSRLQIPIVPPAQRFSLEEPLVSNWIENDPRWRDQSKGFDLGPEVIDMETEFNTPQFQNASGSNRQLESSVPESDRRTSVPRWRPVR